MISKKRQFKLNLNLIFWWNVILIIPNPWPIYITGSFSAGSADMTRETQTSSVLCPYMKVSAQTHMLGMVRTPRAALTWEAASHGFFYVTSHAAAEDETHDAAQTSLWLRATAKSSRLMWVKTGCTWGTHCSFSLKRRSVQHWEWKRGRINEAFLCFCSTSGLSTPHRFLNKTTHMLHIVIVISIT